MATSVSTQFTPPSVPCIGSTRKRKAEGQKTSAVLKKKTASIDDVADAYLNGLCALWDHLQTSTDLKIKLKEVADLGIRHQNLDMSVNPQATQTTFFVPMDKKEVQDYPPDKDQPETDDLLKTYYGDWPPKFSFVSDADHAVNRSNADCLCGTFEVAFGYLRRKKVGDSDSQTFQERKGWRAVDYTKAFDYESWNTSDFWVQSQDSKPQAIWFAEKHPHAMVTIAHRHPHDDACLFLSEIRVIVSLMIVRLLDDAFPKDNIVPVMVISSTVDKHARILQAHMDDDSLVIRSSRFRDFSAKRDAYLEDFLVYMASDLQGITKVRVLPTLKTSFGN